MQNMEFISELKFQSGDGYLSYYPYNYRLEKKALPSELGMVLV